MKQKKALEVGVGKIKNCMGFLFRRYYLRKGVIKLKLHESKISPKYYVRSNLELEKILTKDNEENVLKIFLDKIKPKDIIYDIGANIGLYTLPAALKLRGTGRVVAFEPVPMWFNRLKDNLSLNSIQNVDVYNVGLYIRTEKKVMYIKNIQGSGMGSIVTNYRNEVPEEILEKIEVQLVKGDDFISENKIPLPNIIKIDVEGAELDVIRGLKNTIAHSDCRFILCEVHPKYMTESPTKVNIILEKMGYRVEKIEERGPEYFISASRY